MALDQHAANLVGTTISAFNGDAISVSPTDGISLIDSWISALSNGGQGTNPVVSGLSELKSELRSGNPDGSRIQQIIDDLADQVGQAAMSADGQVKATLDPLVNALHGFSQQLGGSSTMAAMNIDPSDGVMPGQTGGQAPMTSTVGGESTNSGTGTSAMGMNDEDQLSNRSGGTTENGSATGMDDMTGSDGAQRQDSGSRDSGTGSGGDDYSSNSGTRSSGVSGGSAESGSGSSGGRSQY